MNIMKKRESGLKIRIVDISSTIPIVHPVSKVALLISFARVVIQKEFTDFFIELKARKQI